VKILDMSETIGRRGYPEDDERAIKNIDTTKTMMPNLKKNLPKETKKPV
jgi:hypothetical protein